MTLTMALIIFVVSYLLVVGVIALCVWMYCKGFSRGAAYMDAFYERTKRKPKEMKLYEL